MKILRGLSVVLCVCVGAMCLTLASSASAATQTLLVTSTGDGDSPASVGNCAGADTDCTLRDAVNQANTDTGDTIVLQASTTYTLSSTSGYGQLTFTASATLTGAGASSTIISGADATRILEVQAPATLTVSSLTLEHGNSMGGGAGGVLIDPNASMAISNAALSDNATTEQGGAIEDQGTLMVSATSLTGNSAGDGGAIKVESVSTYLASATVTKSTLSGNTATATGGAIRVQSAGTGPGTSLTVNASTFSENTSGLAGGAIEDSNGDDSAQISISDSTIADNTSTGSYGGGGVYLGNGPSADQIINDTIVGNSATGTGAYGGDVLLGGGAGVPAFENTIVADGTAPNGGDCSSAVTSAGHNLESGDQCGFTASGDLADTPPDLGPLQNNGGPTETMALLPGSPAINAGSNTDCPATDERGVARPQGAACDIGAYESAPPVLGPEASAMILQTTANVGASVANPDAQPGTVAFQYGTSTSYGSTTAAQTLAAGTPATSFGASLSGLALGTVYHFRVVATDPDGTVYGPDATFTTVGAFCACTAVTHVPVFSFGKVKVSSKGKLSVPLTVSDAGRVSGKVTFKVRKKVITHRKGKRVVRHVTTTWTYGTGSVTSSGSGTVTLGVSLKGSSGRELKRLKSSKITVTITVTFTSTSGAVVKQSKTITIKRSRKGKYS